MEDLAIDVAGAAPAAVLPVLDEGIAPLDLPSSATLNEDGTVTVQFDFPVTLEFRSVNGGSAQSVHYDSLRLRRLTGADVTKIIAAKASTDVALARASGLSQARIALLTERMDAPDVTALRDTIAAMLGGLDDGLPKHADEIEGVIVLPLRRDTEDGSGATIERLEFKRLTGGDLKAIADAKDTMPAALHRACGLTLKAARDLFDGMDGADAMDAQRVIGFLSGSGRKTGR